MTINMKIDIAKPTQRGLAVGLNEFAGYMGVAVTAAVSGFIAANYSYRPEPFYLGIVAVIIGLTLSLLVKDTKEHIKLQANSSNTASALSASKVFKETTYKKKVYLALHFLEYVPILKMEWLGDYFPYFLPILAYLYRKLD